MDRSTAEYWAKAEGNGLYTLTIVLSDSPGKTVIYGLTKDRCEQEMELLEYSGYDIVSGLRKSLGIFGL